MTGFGWFTLVWNRVFFLPSICQSLRGVMLWVFMIYVGNHITITLYPPFPSRPRNPTDGRTCNSGWLLVTAAPPVGGLAGQDSPPPFSGMPDCDWSGRRRVTEKTQNSVKWRSITLSSSPTDLLPLSAGTTGGHGTFPRVKRLTR